MAWYRTGSVTLTNGSKAVTGVATAFIKNVAAGFALKAPDGKLYEIETVTSDTAATLVTPYAGATAAGAAYEIFPTQGGLASISQQIGELLSTFGGLRDGFDAGVLQLAFGGTGATTAAEARAKLGIDSAIALGSWSSYGGSANAITLTPVVPRAAYVRGDEFRFRATAINTGATTINVGGLGSKDAVTVTGAALPAGYIRTDVDTVCVYDGTRFVVQREIERGSNANGNYTRWADGTQICRGARILASSNNAGNQVTLPAAFRDADYVCLAAGSIASGSIAASNVYEVENQSSSQVLIKALIHTPSSILDGVDARARFAATGEWY